MTDDESSPSPAPELPTVEPYRPFPSFAEFAESKFDGSVFDRYAERLRSAKESVDPDAVRAIVKKATKMAATDTGAIENLYSVDRGFTFSVAADAALWDTIHLVKGEAVQRAIHDALAGYDYVLDLATGSRPLSEAWIRQLHEVLCASQETYTVITSQGPQEQALPKGVYKTQPNNPLNLGSGVVHAYAPVSDTSGEMARLVGEVSSSEFAAAHPILQAAYAHYAFVCVHPFADGNGRVARALASVFLYREPGVPLVVFADQKPAYLDALEAADQGDPTMFTTFVGDRAVDTVRMITDDLKVSSGAPDPRELANRVESSLLGRGGFTHPEIDAMAALLTQGVLDACREVAGDPGIPSAIRVQVTKETTGFGSARSDLRPAPGTGYVTVSATTPNPPAARANDALFVMVAKATRDDADFVVLRGSEVVGDFLIRDLHPALSSATHLRLRTIASALTWDLVARAVAEGEKRLRQGGYL